MLQIKPLFKKKDSTDSIGRYYVVYMKDRAHATARENKFVKKIAVDSSWVAKKYSLKNFGYSVGLCGL